jgi:hypothetical protein
MSGGSVGHSPPRRPRVKRVVIVSAALMGAVLTLIWLWRVSESLRAQTLVEQITGIRPSERSSVDLAEELGEIGPMAVRRIIPAIQADQSPHVRSSLARALEKIGSGARDAVPALVDVMHDSMGRRDPDNQLVVFAALDAIQAIGPAAVEAVPLLNDLVLWPSFFGYTVAETARRAKAALYAVQPGSSENVEARVTTLYQADPEVTLQAPASGDMVSGAVKFSWSFKTAQPGSTYCSIVILDTGMHVFDGDFSILTHASVTTELDFDFRPLRWAEDTPGSLRVEWGVAVTKCRDGVSGCGSIAPPCPGPTFVSSPAFFYLP